MIRKQVRHLLPGMVMCGFMLLLGMAVLPAYGVTKLFSSSPWLAHVDVEKNLLVITTKTGVYAQRLDNGKRVWSLQENRTNYPHIGVDSFLLNIRYGFQVFDISTGKERWRYENKDIIQWRGLSYIGASDWIDVSFDEQKIVCAPDGRTLEPTLDGRKINVAIVAGWMPDGKRLLIGEHVETENELNTLKIYFWDPENNTVEVAYDINSTDYLDVHSISRLEKAVIKEINTTTYKQKFTLIDIYTGAAERSLGESERDRHFTEDGYMLMRAENQKELNVTNLAVDGRDFTLSKEGHTFWPAPVRVYGKSWVYSSDEERRYWLWSLEEDLMPRMIWQAPPDTYLPGEVIAIKLPYILFQTESQMKAYRLEDLVCEKTWGIEDESRRRFNGKTCANFHRAVAYTWKDEAVTGERSTIAQIFEPDNPVPILETAGYASAISPDGRYCLVHNSDKGAVRLVEVDSGDTLATIEEEKMGFVETAFSPDSSYCLVQYPQARKTHLIDVSGGKTCAVIETEEEPENKKERAGRKSDDVLFSPDSRYAIVYAAKQLTFISLNLDYTHRDAEVPEEIKRYAFFPGLTFSPDGNYYAFCQWMHGRVPLYATDTGEVVGTFKEPEKVVPRWEAPPEGFLETAERFGKRLAGVVVTLDQQSPSITSRFSKDGKQLITIAEGEILRVWDINTGKIMRTIRTNLPQYRDDYGGIHNELVLSANSTYAFAYNRDGFGAVSLWEVATGKEITKDNLPPGRIMHVSVANNGSGVYMTINDELYFVAGKKR